MTDLKTLEEKLKHAAACLYAGVQCAAMTFLITLALGLSALAVCATIHLVFNF